MKRIVMAFVAGSMLLSSTVGLAAEPDKTKYANLHDVWAAIQRARAHLAKAETDHAKTTLDGHGKAAVAHLDAAEADIDAAVAYANANMKPGTPGTPAAKPDPKPWPNDKKFPNLGNAHMDVAHGILHTERAEEYHAPIGTLGGNGTKAGTDLKLALKEISEAMKFVASKSK